MRIEMNMIDGGPAREYNGGHMNYLNYLSIAGTFVVVFERSNGQQVYDVYISSNIKRLRIVDDHNQWDRLIKEIE